MVVVKVEGVVDAKVTRATEEWRSGGGDDGGGRKEVTKVKVGSHT